MRWRLWVVLVTGAVLPVGAAAQAPVIWYEWVYVSQVRTDYNKGQYIGCGTSDLTPTVISGDSRIERRLIGSTGLYGGFTYCGGSTGAARQCDSVKCSLAVFTYTKNTSPRPVEISSLTGLPRQTQPMAEMDNGPILEFVRSGDALLYQVGGIVGGGLLKSLVLVVISVPLVMYGYRQVITILHENFLGSPHSTGMAHETQQSLTQAGYDGQE